MRAVFLQGFHCKLICLFLCVRVIATDIEDKKLELAKQMGADITVNTKDQDLKEVSVHFVCCPSLSILFFAT